MRVALLRCDACALFLDYSVIPAATTKAQARTQARTAGWRCDAGGDVCKRCVGRGR